MHAEAPLKYLVHSAGVLGDPPAASLEQVDDRNSNDDNNSNDNDNNNDNHNTNDNSTNNIIMILVIVLII